ncbi:unnamed protein product [Pedinophyceae sp. YPF-701]|nr:unnamed protein product [Pedinophyceae sp. YPF-701]
MASEQRRSARASLFGGLSRKNSMRASGTEIQTIIDREIEKQKEKAARDELLDEVADQLNIVARASASMTSRMKSRKQRSEFDQGENAPARGQEKRREKAMALVTQMGGGGKLRELLETKGSVDAIWTVNKTTTAPGHPNFTGRAGHSALTFSNKEYRIFVFGGNDDSGATSDLFVYNTKSRSWASMAQFYPPEPAAYRGFGLIAPRREKLGKGAVPRILTYGGFANGSVLDSVFVLDEFKPFVDGVNAKSTLLRARPGAVPPEGHTSDIWYEYTQETSGEVPVGRSNHALCVLEGAKLVLIHGGWNTSFVDHVYVLNTDTWRWAYKVVRPENGRVGAAPAGRASHAYCVLPGQRLLIHGGQNAQGQRNDAWILDMRTFEWTRPIIEGATPPGRSGHTMTYLPKEDLVVLLGGWTGSSMVGDVLILDVRGDPKKDWKWLQVNQRGAQFKGRAGHTATLIRDKRIFVIGGTLGTGDLAADVLLLELDLRGLQRGLLHGLFERLESQFDQAGEEEELQEAQRRAAMAAVLSVRQLRPGDYESLEDLDGKIGDARTIVQANTILLRQQQRKHELATQREKERRLVEMRNKIVTRCIQGGATPEEAHAVAEGHETPELMARIMANLRQLEGNGLDAVPPAPNLAPDEVAAENELSKEAKLLALERRLLADPDALDSALDELVLTGGFEELTKEEKARKEAVSALIDMGGPLEGIGQELALAVAVGSDQTADQGPGAPQAGVERPRRRGPAAAPEEGAEGEIRAATRPGAVGPLGLGRAGLDGRKRAMLTRMASFTRIEEDEGEGDADEARKPVLQPDDLMRAAVGSEEVTNVHALTARARWTRAAWAATTIQKWWRARLARRLMLFVRTIVRIQAWYRGFQTRKELRDQGIVLSNTAIRSWVANKARVQRYQRLKQAQLEQLEKEAAQKERQKDNAGKRRLSFAANQFDADLM